MADLKTNYKDDVLDTSKNEKRKFRMIQNDDGTVSFDDATEYTQQGDAFGAADINATNAKINEQSQSLTQLNTDLNGIKSSLLVRSINPTNISNFNEFNVTLEKVGNIVTCQYAISNPYAFGDIDLFQIPSGYAPRGTCYAWTNRRTSTQESCRNQIYISPTNIKFQNNDGSTTLESWGEFTYTIAI